VLGQCLLRYKVKQLTGRDATLYSLAQTLQRLNPILRGWANYYRYCTGIGKVFTSIDWYVTDLVGLRVRRRHREQPFSQL
jgi:RNA-directed DNA polymerase